ncbi:uncharacterized protein [Cherax quadricarinatus]|uniref:uncharacterized protein n=1 Tax=Cherax quadricarinatus TaxID=27406 RepID=UPI002378B44B|nr:uncharacterized protein LOC128695491 [Cherax quadricarinatus]
MMQFLWELQERSCKAVPHSADLPVPTPSERSQPSEEESSNSENKDHSEQDYDLTHAAVGKNPYYPNQTDLNDLIRDFGLTKSNAELLISRLKEWDLVVESVQVTSQRKRHKHFSSFFTNEDKLRYCNDVSYLFDSIGIVCNPDECALFIDSSSRSVKAVLLRNGNKYPSLSLAHSTGSFEL